MGISGSKWEENEDQRRSADFRVFLREHGNKSCQIGFGFLWLRFIGKCGSKGRFAHVDTLYTMAESATPVKLFGKWSLEDVEVSDLALVVRLEICKSSG
jgi:hypothetical protein